MLKRVHNILALLLLVFFLYSLNGCQPQSQGIDRKSHITFSTFTEQHGWQIWQTDLKAKQLQQLTWGTNEAYYPSWGPKGELAYSDHNGHIWLLKENLKQEQQKPENDLDAS